MTVGTALATLEHALRLRRDELVAALREIDQDLVAIERSVLAAERYGVGAGQSLTLASRASRPKPVDNASPRPANDRSFGIALHAEWIGRWACLNENGAFPNTSIGDQMRCWITALSMVNQPQPAMNARPDQALSDGVSWPVDL